MWCSKMAARWRGKDGNLNARKGDFLANNIPNELVSPDMEGIEMDPQSCMDHSILAIFEDSTVVSEDKSGVESETLLSALTEMLDSVEDDDRTLSPFDTLPDTKLLKQPQRRDNSVELSLAERLRPRSKSPNVTFTVKSEGDKEDESTMKRNGPLQLLKQQSESLFNSRNKKVETEVDVFTSTSLVSLVRIMHSYCLKLHVEEEGDRLRRNHTLFSQEEVWKYERPSEESDEEINVVSDDEATVNETKEKEEGDERKLLKSVLLNGNSSKAPRPRDKKRVSFGPVQVTSFDESEDKGLNEKNLTSEISKALENPADSALEPQTLTSDVDSNKSEVLPPKGEAKAKSLSLQQYRQLRQKRQPLVEKQGNYTTKWPCVPEPPKELTPILCLQGQTSCGPKAAQHVPDLKRSGADVYKTHRTSAPPRPRPSESKPSTNLCRSGLKRPRTVSKLSSPTCPLPGVAANTNFIVQESKRSPVKKPTTPSIDPPNPVLLPLPVSQTTSLSDHSYSGCKAEFLNRDSNTHSSCHFTEIQNESSGMFLQLPSSLEPKPEVSLLNKGNKNDHVNIASELSSKSPAMCPTTAQTKSSEDKKPQPQKCMEPKSPQLPNPALAPIAAPTPVKETAEALTSDSPPQNPLAPLQNGCGGQTATADSGIEAADVTSLLEQFEETQAKEERVEPKSVSATSSSNPPTHGHFDRTEQSPLTPPVETLQPSGTSNSSWTQTTLGNVPHLQPSEVMQVPEPLGTEIILSTENLPARRKNPPSKAIQIIDPRPMPSKKIHINLPEFPAAHIYSSISSDHDYCGPVDSSLLHISQRSGSSKVMDDELQVTSHDLTPSECKKQMHVGEVDSNIIDVKNSAKSVMQYLHKEPRTRSETNPSTDTALYLTDRSASEKDCRRAAENKTPPCTLPTPPPSPTVRGRAKRRYQRRPSRTDSSSSSCSSSSSAASSSSASPSPKRQKRRHKRSESSSCSSSCSRSVSRSPPRRHRWSHSRLRCSRSRSRSWSQSRSPSRSRSPSPQICHRKWRDVYSSRESRQLRRDQEIRLQKLKAIDERRVVYVGRICRSMTHHELRERFSQFGVVECVSLHFRDRGDHYGFVTFYNMEDAFAAIDNGGKLRRPDELPFDICFGGRRQFCNSDYADLDANRDAEPSPAKSRYEDVDFDSLLKQAQRGLKR